MHDLENKAIAGNRLKKLRTGGIMKKILRKKDVRQITGLADTTLWRMEKLGKFPSRLRLGGGAVGWLEDEVEGWIEQKAAEREPAN